MRPDEIEELLQTMNPTQIVMTIRMEEDTDKAK
jgi:hypothetical protein